MRRCVACVHRGLGRRAQRSSCIFSGSSARVSPSRWLTRVTCVSTAMAGIPKALPSTTLAVLRPTPGSATRSSVHCADRMVAARSSRGVVKSSSIPAFGYALARRPRILTALAFFAAADSAMVGLGEGGADLPDAPRHLVFGELLRLVGEPPDGPVRLGIAGQTRHEMP